MAVLRRVTIDGVASVEVVDTGSKEGYRTQKIRLDVHPSRKGRTKAEVQRRLMRDEEVYQHCDHLAHHHHNMVNSIATENSLPRRSKKRHQERLMRWYLAHDRKLTGLTRYAEEDAKGAKHRTSYNVYDSSFAFQVTTDGAEHLRSVEHEEDGSRDLYEPGQKKPCTVRVWGPADTGKVHPYHVLYGTKGLIGLQLPQMKVPVAYAEDTRRGGGVARVRGKPESSRVVRDGYRMFACIVQSHCPATVYPEPIVEFVGVDVNTHAIVCSDPRFGKNGRYPVPKELRKLAKRRREIDSKLGKLRHRAERAGHQGRGSRKQTKLLDLRRRLNQQAKDIRTNWLHTVTTDIVRKARYVAIEDLNVAGMTGSAKGDAENPGKNVRAKAGLNAAILNASFGKFRTLLEYKCHGDRTLVLVQPHYTSMTCNQCGHINPKCSRRDLACEGVLEDGTPCGAEYDRDDNASLNIKFLAQEAVEGACAGPEVRGGEGTRLPNVGDAQKRTSQPVPEAAEGKPETREPAHARKTGGSPRSKVRAKSRGDNMPPTEGEVVREQAPSAASGTE